MRCKMEIPLNAQVECTDGVCGRSEYVLINPVIEEVAQLVVKVDGSPKTEVIVPVELVNDTDSEKIRLRCSKAELEQMEPFVTRTYIEERVPDMNYAVRGNTYVNGTYMYLPYVTAEKTIQVPVEEPQVPPGELAVHRGTQVKAADGEVGKVDEFVINPENGHITHLVMREGHLLGKKDVVIPLSAIGEIREDTVYLKLSKVQIDALPDYTLRRRWII
jgi:hypothetical protein